MMLSNRDADDELVDRFLNGENSAFDQLATKYRPRLLRVASRYVYDRADAQDVVQETFVRAIRGLPAFRRDAGFYSWLFKIGINVAKDLQGTQFKRACISSQHNSDFEPDPAPSLATIRHTSPLTILQNKQIIMALARKLDELPIKFSAPLMLYGLEGKTYEEIASTLVCPVGTVRSRIFRARKMIADHLAPLVDLP